MVTLLAVVILDVDLGLGVGVAFYIIAHIVRSTQYDIIQYISQFNAFLLLISSFNLLFKIYLKLFISRPYATLLGHIPGTEIYKDTKLYKNVKL